MIQSASRAMRHPASRVLRLSSRPLLTFALCYAAGLLATGSLGVGAADAPLMSFGAPAVAALAIRFRRGLHGAEVAMLAAVRFAMMAGTGEDASAASVSFALDLAAIWCASTVFGALRTRGFITSQARVTAAAAAAAAAAALPLCAPQLADAAFGGATLWLAGAVFLSTGLGALLILMVALTADRADRCLAFDPSAAGEKPPSRLEAIVAAATLTGFVAAAVLDGRQELALGASAVLLWFALRLGLFATALSGFVLVAALQAFAVGDAWAALRGVEAGHAEVLRVAALLLLVSPSLFVAASVHDHRSARRDFAMRALYDGLTQLANRACFLDVLTEATEAARAKGKRFALYLIDLDHFKSINDGHGHPTGDALLVEVSRRLRDTIRATDLVARLGGDEFAVIAPVPTIEDAGRLAKRLVAAIDQPAVVEGLKLSPSVTIGVVVAPDSSVDAERLMALADHALYEAKAAGRNTWRVCSASAEDAFAVDWKGEAKEPSRQIVYLD